MSLLRRLVNELKESAPKEKGADDSERASKFTDDGSGTTMWGPDGKPLVAPPGKSLSEIEPLKPSKG